MRPDLPCKLPPSPAPLTAPGVFAPLPSNSKQLAELREAEEAKLSAIMDARQKARDVSERKKEQAKKKAEAKASTALEARKQLDVQMAEAMRAMRAEEHVKKMEVVWSTAEQHAQRCQVRFLRTSNSYPYSCIRAPSPFLLSSPPCYHTSYTQASHNWVLACHSLVNVDFA